MPVERRPDDRPFDAGAHQRPDVLDVRQGRDATRRDDRAISAGANLLQQLKIGALEHAVLVDVGDDVASASLAVETLEGLPEVTALLRPAARRKRGAANIETDGDPVAILGNGRSGPLRVLQCCRAEVDPAAAGRQRGRQALGVTDATRHLDLDVEATDDAGEQLTVGAAPEGGVEVDQVDPLGTLVLPRPGGLPRVAELAAGAGDPLDELDRLPAGDIDGWQELKANS